MESTLIYITLAVSAATLALCAYLALKMKTVLYLLEQPVVKKMSPQLKLKPVKIDELVAERNRQQQQQQQQQGNRPPQQNGRPQQGGGRHDRNDHERRPDFNRGDRQDNRDRPDRRPDFNRGEGGGGRDRNQDRDRFRDRDRNRDNRPPGGDRFRPQQPENRDASQAPISEPARSEAPAPIQNQNENHVAPLAPRRPLPATVETETTRVDPVTSAAPEAEGGEGLFGGDDVQHGRRTQIKKKPRFEVDEEEVKTTTEG